MLEYKRETVAHGFNEQSKNLEIHQKTSKWLYGFRNC